MDRQIIRTYYVTCANCNITHVDDHNLKGSRHLGQHPFETYCPNCGVRIDAPTNRRFHVDTTYTRNLPVSA